MLQEFEAVVALLFGLTQEQVGTIYETFHRGWDHTNELSIVLKHYDQWIIELSNKEPRR